MSWMVKLYFWLMHWPVSLKDLFLVHFFSWFVLMIYQMTYIQTLNCLLVIHLFSVLCDKNLPAKDFNDNFQKIHVWTHQWKMSFNPDSLNQEQEVIFFKKHIKTSPPVLF